MMKCCVCPTDADEFVDINDLEAHIAAEHFDCVPFECEKCRFSKFPTEFAIKRHFEEDHCLKEYYIRYKISNGLTEKLCSVRECLQRCCESAGVEFPYAVFPAPLNNVDEAMARRVYRRAPASNASSAADCGGTNAAIGGADSGVTIKCENDRFDAYSPSNSLEGDAPPVAVAVANGDGPSAALTAFLQSATQALNNNTMDENQQAQQLLRNLECQLSNHNGSNLMIRRKRQMDKRMSLMARNAKRRFGQDANNTSAGATFSTPQRHQDGGSYAGGGGSVGVNRNGSFANFFPPSFNNGSAGGNNFVGGSARHMPAARQPSKVNEVQCQECKEMVTNRATSLNYHVNMKHLKYALFVCKGCNRQFLWQKTTIVTHVQRYHGGDESLIEDNSSLYMSQINLSRKIFFPVKCPAGGTATITSATPLAKTSAISGGGMGDLSTASAVDFGDLTGGSGLMSDDSIEPLTSASAGSVVIAPSNNNRTEASEDDDDEEEADNDDDDEENDEDGASNDAAAGEQQVSTAADAFGTFHYGHHHNSSSSASFLPPQVSAPTSASPGGGRSNGHYFHNFSEPLTADYNYGNSAGNFDAALMIDGGADERKSRQLQCQECQEMVVATKPWILLNHANSQHMNFPLFECGACHQVFTKYLRSYTVTHMKRYHDGREDLIIDNRPAYHARLQTKCLELFGISI